MNRLKIFQQALFFLIATSLFAQSDQEIRCGSSTAIANCYLVIS